MAQYKLPDLSGTNEDFLVINLPATIYRIGMKVIFKNSPVHVTSLRIIIADGSGYRLQRDVDYTVNGDDLDDYAMSQAFTEDANFTGLLARSVTIISTRAVGKRVAMSFQQFYDVLPNAVFDNGLPVEFTPDTFRSLMSGLADCRQQLAHVVTPGAPTNAAPALLPFDINCEFAGNVVTDEVITVNTVVGPRVIRLAAGAYFADSLHMTYNGQPLSAANGDYLPVGYSALTARTTNPSGIYQYVLLNGSYTGPITITSYHAVGGDVQMEDVQSLYDLMMGIRTFLNEGIFITSDTIVETPAFRAFNARLNSLETKMRNLLSGTPTYGDATGGGSVIRPIAAQDGLFHWWTIANLYQVEGSPDLVYADQFRGRVFFPGMKVAVTFTLDYNMNQTRDQATFRTENLVFDPTYTLFGDLSNVAPIYPIFRVVWNQTVEGYSGASIQVGIPVPALTDQMIVEDLSTSQSCWILDKTGQFITGGQTILPQAPKDNGFTLPDGSSIWSSSSSVSKKLVFAPRYEEGYLVYTGTSVALNQLTSLSSTGALFSVRLPASFPITSIKTLVITLANADGSIVYDLNVTLPKRATGVRSGRETFADAVGELLALSATINQDAQGNYALSLNVKDISGTQQAPSAMADIVRYVRALV